MPIIRTEENKVMTPEKLELIESGFNRPIAGQALTNSPENPYDWEKPPKYTTVPEASMAIFVEMTKEETFMPLIEALSSGFPVVDMANLILYRGFQKGQFSPDLMLLLIEPVIYMILALAEKVGIGDVVGYDGEEDDDEGDPEEQVKTLNELKQALKLGSSNITEESIKDVPELKKEIEEFEVPENIESLLQKQTPINQTDNMSLLAKEI
tara:strand:+ start:1977 stop:2606 length:630 start_codon:yes stop_codon:yes gene_type:complete